MKTTRHNGKVAVTLTELEKHYKTFERQDKLAGVYQWIGAVDNRHAPSVTATLDKSDLQQNMLYNGIFNIGVLLSVAAALEGIETIILNK